MKKVLTKDLVVGREYWDLPDKGSNLATKLKFIGFKPGLTMFEYISGKKYPDGIKVDFTTNTEDDWYEEQNIFKTLIYKIKTLCKVK